MKERGVRHRVRKGRLARHDGRQPLNGKFVQFGSVLQVVAQRHNFLQRGTLRAPGASETSMLIPVAVEVPRFRLRCSKVPVRGFCNARGGPRLRCGQKAPNRRRCRGTHRAGEAATSNNDAHAPNPAQMMGGGCCNFGAQQRNLVHGAGRHLCVPYR